MACLWEEALKAKLRSGPRRAGSPPIGKPWRPTDADRRPIPPRCPFCPRADRDSRQGKSQKGGIRRRAPRGWFRESCAKCFWILEPECRPAEARETPRKERLYRWPQRRSPKKHGAAFRENPDA